MAVESRWRMISARRGREEFSPPVAHGELKTQQGCQSLPFCEEVRGSGRRGMRGGSMWHVKIGCKWVQAGQAWMESKKGPRARLFAVSTREDRSSSTRPAGPG